MTKFDQYAIAVAALTAQLHDWQSAKDFASIVGRLSTNIDQSPRQGVVPHRHREFSPWREAWVLLQALPAFGTIKAIRLLRQGNGTPDAEVDNGTMIEPVEVTEVTERGSRPGVPKPSPRLDGGPEVWRARVADFGALLDEAGQKKAAKPYARDTVLLVYVNAGDTYFDVGREDAEAAISEFKRRYAHAFKRIHVLWDSRLY